MGNKLIKNSIVILTIIVLCLPSLLVHIKSAYANAGVGGGAVGAGLGGDVANTDLSETASEGLTKEEFEKTAGQILAGSPAECTTTLETVDGKKVPFTPRNCLFLEEPIGGKPGYDLFIETCGKDGCEKTLWTGGAIPPNARGPIQAVLTQDPDKPYQGPFGLLYSYVGLLYSYISGLIVGVAVLFVVIGGIQMTTSGGDQGKFDAGKSRIVKAVVGMILWFTASLILYTINPTFFTF